MVDHRETLMSLLSETAVNHWINSMLLCGSFISDAVYFHFAVYDHGGHDARSRGRVIRKIAFEHTVKRREVSRIIEPDAASDNVFFREARLCENGQQILDCLM